MTGDLWHYTCDHAARKIDGVLTPGADRIERIAELAKRGLRVPWTTRLVWLTDLDYPDRDALGLTSTLLTCDRTAHRYRVLDVDQCVPWTSVRRDFPRHEWIEAAPGVMPRHWFVAFGPIRCEYAPIGDPAPERLPAP